MTDVTKLNTTIPPTLYIYILNGRQLSIRREKIKAIVKVIAECYQNLPGYTGNLVIPKFITSHDPVELEPKLNELKDIIAYERCGDEDFDRFMEQMNIETLSNTFKHQDVWRLIGETSGNTAESLHLVIEDDTVIMKEGMDGLKDVLSFVSDGSNNDTWDMMFLGLSQPNAEDKSLSISLSPVSNTFKIVPSKEAYFLSKSAAARLYKTWTESKITYSLRIQLSKFLHQNPSFKAVFPNRRVTIDGSKVGFFATSIHNSNLLIYNGEYVELFNIYNMPIAEMSSKLARATELYNVTRQLNSPDMTHIYGIILVRAGRLNEAEEIFTLAIEQTKQAQGILNNRGDLCNNIVNLYKDMQTDIAKISATPSKYSMPGSTIPFLD